MMREYIVTCKTKEDLQSLYDDMETPGGNLYIPDREVELKHRRPISRNTHYMLTEEEAEQIKQDPRVLDVALTPEERGAKIKPLYIIEGEITEEENQRELNNNPSYNLASNRWSKTTNDGDTFRNWGMIRCVNEETFQNWGNDNIPNIISNNTTVTCQFTSTGKNVDVVIVDGCIDPAHPEYAVNENGTGGSRVQQFNWFSLNPEVTGGAAGTYLYTDGGLGDYTTNTPDQTGDNNHGCHVAGTACGNRRGWARGANIYNINPYGSAPSVISSSLMIDYIRAWHNSKDVNPDTGKANPTITNHSYGIFYDVAISNVEWVLYRGTLYNAPLTAQQCTDFGLVNNGTTILDIPLLSTAAEADIIDAILDGIIFIAAAGNSSFKTDISGGIDYDNAVKETGFSGEFYHRGSSPSGLANVISVGAISELQSDQKANYSNCGPRVNVYAPGTNIISSVLTGGVSDSRNGTYRVIKYPGTSMASPQVAGVVACLAEHWPRLTHEEVYKYFNSDNYWSKTHLATLGQIGNSGSETLSYTVVNNGASDYTFSGDATGNDPALTVTEGQVLEFNINAPGHPFWIKTTNVTGTGSGVTEGTISGNGVQSGTITWDTTGVTAGTYYYICQFHSGMVGTITVQAVTSTASLQGSKNSYLRSPKIRRVPNPAGTTYVGAATTSQQTWPRLDNKFRANLVNGDLDYDYWNSAVAYPRPHMWHNG